MCSDVRHQINDPLFSVVYGTYVKFKIVSLHACSIGSIFKSIFYSSVNFLATVNSCTLTQRG